MSDQKVDTIINILYLLLDQVKRKSKFPSKIEWESECVIKKSKSHYAQSWHNTITVKNSKLYIQRSSWGIS